MNEAEANEPQEAGGELREFIGFVWESDWDQRVGILLYAKDASEAGGIARDFYGQGFRISVWNEDDASRQR